MPFGTFEVRFGSLAHGGEAVGRLPDGRAVFVPFALPGELARIEVLSEKRRFARGRVVELLEASSERVNPRCKHFGRCGGCQLQHLEYPEQLEAKTQIVRDQLMRIGHIPDPPVARAVGARDPWHYRNHVQFHLDDSGALGFVAADYGIGPPHVLAVRECHLPDEHIGAMWPRLSFREDSKAERITLRSGSDGALMLITEAGTPQTIRQPADGAGPAANPQEGEAGPGRASHLDLVVLGRSFRISPTTFFQVNLPMAEALVRHVLAYVPNDCGVIIDSYCGAGLFSAFLAPLCGKLIGIEAAPDACEDFTVNLHDFDNVDLYEDAAANVFKALDSYPDLVVVDPPRAGLDGAALRGLMALQPAMIMYVSCDPATLARDVREMTRAGYRLENVTPFDMFPQTFHIESVSILRPSLHPGQTNG